MHMNVRFAKISPGGNVTILVESAVSKADRVRCAQWLMSPEGIGAEQVGFIVPAPKGADAALEMMGGELCINALRSLSAFLFSRDATKFAVDIHSTGMKSLVHCTNTRTKQGEICTSLRLTMKTRIERLSDSWDLVHMEGISHFVRKVESLPTSEEVQKYFSYLSETYAKNVEHLPAFGVIPFIQTKPGTVSSVPLVYVRDTNSTVFETGCGSGSIAIALSQMIGKSSSLIVLQPSGVPYDVFVSLTDHAAVVDIGSPVAILAEGECLVP